MKWLMRHKLYTRDDKLAQAALLMSLEFPQSAQDKVSELQTFIQKMIGSDDDTTLADLQGFAREH